MCRTCCNRHHLRFMASLPPSSTTPSLGRRVLPPKILMLSRCYCTLSPTRFQPYFQEAEFLTSDNSTRASLKNPPSTDTKPTCETDTARTEDSMISSSSGSMMGMIMFKCSNEARKLHLHIHRHAPSRHFAVQYDTWLSN